MGTRKRINTNAVCSVRPDDAHVGVLNYDIQSINYTSYKQIRNKENNIMYTKKFTKYFVTILLISLSVLITIATMDITAPIFLGVCSVVCAFSKTEDWEPMFEKGNETKHI